MGKSARKISESEDSTMKEKAKNMTIAEMVDQYDFIEAVLNIPERKVAEPRVDFCPMDYGPGIHQKGVDWRDGGYGYLYAELSREHESRKESVRNRRANNRKHPENKAERKKNKQSRMRKMYGTEEQWAQFQFKADDPLWCRGGWYWYDKREGKKNPLNPEQDVIRNRKYADRERIIRSDWESEQENHAEQMQKIRNLDNFAEGLYEMAEEERLTDRDRMEIIAECNSACYESHRLWLDEEYYRKSQSWGIDARIYLGISYRG